METAYANFREVSLNTSGTSQHHNVCEADTDTNQTLLFLRQQTSRVYEEIREDDRQSRSPPKEVSTVYTCAIYTKSHGVKTTDEYSLATDPAPCPQNLVRKTVIVFQLSKKTVSFFNPRPKRLKLQFLVHVLW